jgi:hypothetical protein
MHRGTVSSPVSFSGLREIKYGPYYNTSTKSLQLFRTRRVNDSESEQYFRRVENLQRFRMSRENYQTTIHLKDFTGYSTKIDLQDRTIFPPQCRLLRERCLVTLVPPQDYGIMITILNLNLRLKKESVDDTNGIKNGYDQGKNCRDYLQVCT